MPTWKKVVISGSGVAQLSNDANYLIDAQSGAILTGSFTGSFVGDGSGLINIVAPGTISASAQVVVQDTTGFSGLQSNISSSISDLSSSAATASTSLSGSAHTQRTAISGAFATTQATQDGRLNSLENFTASLNDTFATDAELNSATASVKTYTDTEVNTLSGSAYTDRVAKVSTLSGSAHTQRVAIETSLQSNIDSAISTANSELNASSSALTSAYQSADTALSSSAHTQRVAIETSLDGKIDTEKGRVDAILSASSADKDSFAEIVALINSVDTTNDQAFAAFYTASNDRLGLLETNSGSQDTRITDLESFSSSLDSTFATNSELSSLSGSAHTDRIAKVATLSGSAHTQRVAIETGLSSDISSLSGSAHTQRVALSASLKGYTDQKVADLVGGAPELLDTLNELAAAIGDDAAISGSFATTLATKASITQLNASSSTLQTNIDDVYINAISTANSELNASSSALQTNIDGAISTANSELNASSSALITAYQGADTALSSSFATTQATQDGRLNSLESFSSSLDATFATEAELNTATASVKTYADTEVNTLSGSAYTDRVAKVSTLSGSAHTQRIAISGALATTISNLSQTLSISGSTGDVEVDLKTQDLTISGDGGGITTSITGQTISLVSNGIISASAEGDAQGQIKLNGVNVDINALGTGDSPTFENLTINGNLTTLGTVTNVNTTDLNIEDKFILLNSGSSSGNSGIIIQNSATIGEGTALFYDDTENRWGLDHVGANAVEDTATADSYVAAVTTDDSDANLQKNGNIYVDTVSGEAFIYVA